MCFSLEKRSLDKLGWPWDGFVVPHSDTKEPPRLQSNLWMWRFYLFSDSLFGGEIDRGNLSTTSTFQPTSLHIPDGNPLLLILSCFPRFSNPADCDFNSQSEVLLQKFSLCHE